MNVLTVEVDFSKVSEEEEERFWETYSKFRDHLIDYLKQEFWDWTPGVEVEVKSE